MSDAHNLGDASTARHWAGIVRGVQAVQHAVTARLEELGISLPYFSVLTMLLEAEDNRLPMSRIARDLSMTSGGFTKLADRMATSGLIDRRGSSGDRRVVFAALTPAGRELAMKADVEYSRVLSEQLGQRITSADFETLARIAERLSDLPVQADLDVDDFRLSARPEDAPDRRSGWRGRFGERE